MITSLSSQWGIQLFHLMLVLGQYLVLEVTRSLTGSEHPQIQHAERLRKDTMSDSLTGREGRGYSELLRFAHLLKTFCVACCGYSEFRWLIFPLSEQNYSTNPTTSQHLPAQGKMNHESYLMVLGEGWLNRDKILIYGVTHLTPISSE